MKKEITTEFVLITPEIASSWLDEKINCQNRPISRPAVERYAFDMRTGRWDDTGAPIKFDECGRLFDGQTRLKAICESGVAIKMLVLRNVPNSALRKEGGGLMRSFSDSLSIEKYANAAHLSAITARAYAYSVENIAKNKRSEIVQSTRSVLWELLQKNLDLINAASYTASKEGADLRHLVGSIGNVGLLYIMSTRLSEEAGAPLCHYLSPGLVCKNRVRKFASNSAAYGLREALIGAN